MSEIKKAIGKRQEALGICFGKINCKKNKLHNIDRKILMTCETGGRRYV